MGLKFLDEAPANGVGHASSSDQVTPSSTLKPDQESPAKKGTRTKEVVFDVGDSRRSSNSVYVPDGSDFDEEETSEQDMDLLDDTSRIPRYES